MIGYHAVPVIADAYLKGIKGFDADKALKAMIASATYGQYGDLKDYMKLGYVPIDREPEAASKTVEYAYDDWTIAMMAKKMGKDDIAATFSSARRTGATASISRPAGCGRGFPTASSASRSARSRSNTAPIIPRATPGNIRGSCRRTRAG